MGFAQREQPEAMVHVAVADQHAGDGRVARAAWMQAIETFDLRADLGRGIQQEPMLVVGTDRDRLLGARARLQGAAAYATAIRAAAVPLWKPAASR
jgi:hypothetical protein